jgi:trk system potassium uptake protein
MLFRPDADDIRVIGRYTGMVLYGVAAAMLLPALLAVVVGERNEALAFVIGASLAAGTGAVALVTCRTRSHLSAGQGLATVALAWTIAPLFGAVPLLLSGHYMNYLDAYFEAMSGFATIGLTLANDLDHMAWSVNLWRHLMHVLGGQGIVIVVLTIFASAGGAIGTLYTGDGEKDRILPNVVSSATFILRVVAAYAAIGLPLLWVAVWQAGVDPLPSVFHAFTLFATAFDTAGFAPTSTSAAFYRSAFVEGVLIWTMVAGAFSFAIHYQLWQGRRRELTRSLETRTIAVSVLIVFLILVTGLMRTGTFTTAREVFRHGFFQTVSAHTTTGLATVPQQLFVSDWGVLAPAMIVVAMALGGMAGSTAGGIKAIRVGLLVKGIRRDIRRVLLPENAIVIETYYSGGRRILKEEQVRGAATILLLYLVLYLGGGMLGLFYGYDLRLALFESTAASATGGLSVGLVRPELEWPLKVTYIVQMLIGRLEFVAVFALAGYLVALVRGRG